MASKKNNYKRRSYMIDLGDGAFSTVKEYCLKNDLSYQSILLRLLKQYPEPKPILLSVDDPILNVRHECRRRMIGILPNGSVSIYHKEIDARKSGAVKVMFTTGSKTFCANVVKGQELKWEPVEKNLVYEGEKNLVYASDKA